MAARSSASRRSGWPRTARLEIHQATDAGCVRPENQDTIGSWPLDDGIVFAVADGLGGVAGGKLASEIALESLARGLDESPARWPIAKRLRRAIQDANLRIYNKGLAVPELRGLGTTITATAIVGSALVSAHVGDCRLFLLRAGELRQLTRDHSWVADQVQIGLLTVEQARLHPRRHLLTRSLGKELIVPIDVVTTEVRSGDVLLQCSDGVHAFLPRREIGAVLREHPAEASCGALIERALDAGGDDNLSAQVVLVTGDTPAAPPSERASWWPFRRSRP